MSVRFSAPVYAFGARMNRASIYGASRSAQNDNEQDNANDTGNGGNGAQAEEDACVTSIAEALKCKTLDAALRHFADYGLAAALNARRQAEVALAHDDIKAYDKWLEICRSLDRRMAQDLDSRKIEMDGLKTASI